MPIEVCVDVFVVSDEGLFITSCCSKQFYEETVVAAVVAVVEADVVVEVVAALLPVLVSLDRKRG